MYRRYAVFFCPAGALGAFGAAWLGWDSAAGEARAHPVVPGLPVAVEKITGGPRKYGFHATIKPPFRLAEGQDEATLLAKFETVCRDLAPVEIDGLQIARLGGFLALVPRGDARSLTPMAGTVVQRLDTFRAPATQAELARRRQARLGPEQEANLLRWGYPYVMDEFRFHITLTGRLAEADRAAVMQALARATRQVLPRPVAIDRLSLLGEAADGRYHRIADGALTAKG